jgi:hypothetical protein
MTVKTLVCEPARCRRPPSAASPMTPVLQTPALPLPTSETARDESDAQPGLPARSPTPNARSPSVRHSRKHGLDILTGVSPSSATNRYETPLEPRGLVVEEDDVPDHDHSQASRPAFDVQSPLRYSPSSTFASSTSRSRRTSKYLGRVG